VIAYLHRGATGKAAGGAADRTANEESVGKILIKGSIVSKDAATLVAIKRIVSEGRQILCIFLKTKEEGGEGRG